MDVDTGRVVPYIAALVQTRVDGKASEPLDVVISRASKGLHTDDMVDGYRSMGLVQRDERSGWTAPIEAQEIESRRLAVDLHMAGESRQKIG